jgi:hypothetical protein
VDGARSCRGEGRDADRDGNAGVEWRGPNAAKRTVRDESDRTAICGPRRARISSARLRVRWWALRALSSAGAGR